MPRNEGSPECLEWEHDKAASQQSKNYSDLKPADDALHGVAPFYMVTDQLSPDVVVDPDYTFQFSDWLMVPYMPSSDCGVPGDEFSPPGPVIYILAWNPTTHRNELAIGPNELQTVLTHEEDAGARHFGIGLIFFSAPLMSGKTGSRAPMRSIWLRHFWHSTTVTSERR